MVSDTPSFRGMESKKEVLELESAWAGKRFVAMGAKIHVFTLHDCVCTVL